MLGISILYSGIISMKDHRSKEEGQGIVEYALILVLVSIVVLFVLTITGPALGNIFSTIIMTI
jgi:pilus assembly protein Flp/PilA